MKESNLKALFKDSSIYGIGNVIKKMVGLLLVPFYTRALSPEQFGILNTLGILVSMMVIVGNAGMLGATKRYFFKAPFGERETVIATGLIISVGIVCTMVLSLLPFSTTISQLLFNTDVHSLLIIITLMLVITTVLIRYNDQIFRLYRQPQKYLFVMSFRAIINPALGILLVVVLSMGVLGAQLASLLAIISVLLFSFFLFTKSKIRLSFDKRWAKKMLLYGIPFIGAGLAQWIYTSSDRIFLAHYADYDDVGYYSIAQTFAQPIQLINMTLAMSFSVLMMSNYESETDINKPKTKKFLIQTWKAYIVIAASIMLFLSVFATDLLNFITTPEYSLGALGIPFHCISMILYQSGQTTGGGMAIKEKTKPYMWAMFITAGINLVLNFIFIPLYGFIGALASTMLSQLLYLIIIYNWSQKYFKVDHQVISISLLLILFLMIGAFFPFAQLKYNIDISVWYKIAVFFLVLPLPFVFGLVKFETLRRIYLLIKSKI
ncbi:MAG: oligosaccharide flippase family protein [Bacteroidales bacterium]|nr:oligosaccharide flippase family protein [Bacteroidales bacterium]